MSARCPRAAFRRSLLVLALAAATPAFAADPVSLDAVPARRYDLPAGPLGRTLSGFAVEAGVALSFDPALTEGLDSPPLSGHHTGREAMARLLAGSGLELVPRSDGSYALRRRAAAPATAARPDARAELLPTVTVRADAERSSTTEGSGSYTTAEVSLGKGQALKDIAQSVSVVTRQQIEDQGLTTLTETLDKTTGVTVNRRGTLSGISHGNDSNFMSRGFTLSNIQIDGGASMDTDMSGFGSISQLDMAQFDHVEFLRGVDGLFSSTGEPGGTVNLVRKRPLAERQATLALSSGSWNHHRLEADVGGPLALEGRVRGRVGLAHEDRRYFYDVAQSRKSVLYGSIETDLTPDTLLTFGGSYQTTDATPSVGGLPRYTGGGDIGLPRRTGLTADWSRSEESARQLFAKLEQRLGADWSWSLDAVYLDIARDANLVYALGAIDPIERAGARWYSYPATSSMQRLAVNAHLKGAFDAFGRRHEMVVGTDFSRGHSYGLQRRGLVSGTEFDIFNVTQPQDLGTEPAKDDHRTSRRVAAYGSLRLALSDATRLIVGGRYSSYAFETHNTQWNVDGSVARVQDLGTVKTTGIFTPYVGATWALNPQWNAYASYAETYQPQDASLRGPLPGTPLGPVESKNIELGIKGALVPGKLNAAFALYRIARTGEAMDDPAYEPQWGIASCCYLNQGKVISQGFDAEISGEIARGLQVAAGYTYNSNADKQAEGARYNAKTPRHLLKLWSNYRPAGLLARWKFGAGVNLQSANHVDGWATTYNPATGKWDGEDVPFKFRQGGYAVWNARVDYEIDKRWSVALNVNNLFDKTYYQTVGYNYFGNFYGEPRSAMLSLRGRF